MEGLVSIDRLEEFTGQRACIASAIMPSSPNHIALAQVAVQQVYLRIGDRIRVRAERIDPMRHRVEFAPSCNRASVKIWISLLIRLFNQLTVDGHCR